MQSILLEHVSKSYPDQSQKRDVLKDISFQIKQGEFVSIIGPNGSGKSTLFSLLLGIIQPDSGKIIRTVQNGRLGFVFQNYRDSLMPWATVLDNLLLPLEQSPMTLPEKHTLAREILTKVGLQKFADYHIHQVSGGMSQLATLARALIVNPQLLLLDEPFSALDYQRSINMQEVVAKFCEQEKTTTFMISHDIDEAIYLSDTIIILSGEPGTIKEIIHNPLPRPRDFQVRLAANFEKLRARVLRIIESNETSL